MTLAEGAASALNRIILDLCIKATKEVGGSVRHYFDVGIFGYGVRADESEGVESALGTALSGQPLVPLNLLADNPVGLREERSADSSAAPVKVPVWVGARYGCRTPMCAAIAEAGQHVFGWAAAHPNSFPPIVINITDGKVTDSPHQGADLSEWARRLTTIQTNDGSALLLNIFLSQSSGGGVLFPADSHGLPEPGPQLFAISSELPAKLVENARAAQVTVEPGARALGFNADLAMLVRFLEIGTRVAEIKDW